MVRAAAALTLLASGCVLRATVVPERLPLEPARAPAAGPASLEVGPEVAAATVVLRVPFTGGAPGASEYTAALGPEVADAWERALALDFGAVASPPHTAGGSAPGVVLSAVSGTAWREGVHVRVDVEVTSLVSPAGGRPQAALTVRGRGDEAAATYAGALGLATARAVKQAAESFRAGLAGAAEPVEAAVARGPPFDPARGALLYELGAGVGVSEQLDGDAHAAWHLAGRLGWAGRRLRLGVEGGYEAPALAAARSGWVGASCGWVAAGASERRLELVAAVGRRFYAPEDGASFGGTTEVLSDGGAGLGYGTARAVLWLGPRQIAVGLALWAQSTLGTARRTYRVRTCSFLGCGEGLATARYGGLAGGISLVVAGQAALDAPPAGAGPD
ncbi:MAG: hypothetical protein U0229_08115 [Anaeromyxobacter sp.]